MTDIINTNIESTPSQTNVASVQQVSTDATTAANAVQSNTTKKEFSVNTTLDSVGELKEKAPEVYDKMMLGIAQTIVKSMRQHQEKLKEIMRKSREVR